MFLQLGMFVGNYNPSNREAGKGELKKMQRLFKKKCTSHILPPSGYHIRKDGLAWLCQPERDFTSVSIPLFQFTRRITNSNINAENQAVKLKYFINNLLSVRKAG